MLSACSGADDASSTGATVAAATSTTDPYAVPATIDIPYLNRVFLALDAIVGEATRLVVTNRAITPRAAALLHAVLADEEFKVQSEDLNDSIDEGLTTYRTPPGNRITRVTRIRTARADCVAVEVQRDYTAVSLTGTADAAALVSLARAQRSELNATPWVITAQLKAGQLPCE